MCRMIAAIGDLDPARLAAALKEMAANRNPAHTHEKRALGEAYRHDDGWGAAWVDGDTLRVRHSIHSCLEDPLFDEVHDFETDLLVLHARRASRPGTVSLENTHPFLVEYDGRPWAFCHNGTIHNIGQLRPAMGLVPAGSMDSELLFHHVLNHLEGADLERSLVASLDRIDDYTALMMFLANTDAVFATAKRHPNKGLREYHALWEGRGPRLRVVASEPLDGIGCTSWKRVPDSSVVTLKRGIPL